MVDTIWPVCVLTGTGRTRRLRRELGAAIRSSDGGQVTEPRVLVDVGDGHLGEALAQPGHDLGGREAAAAEVEEVVTGLGRRSQDVAPHVLQPPRRPREPRRLLRRLRRERPRQRVAVDLARGLRRQVLARGPAGARGTPGREERKRRHGDVEVEGVVDGDVPDQELVAGAGAPHGGGGRRSRPGR